MIDAADVVPDVASQNDAEQAVSDLLLIASGRPIITGFDSVDSSSQEVDPNADDAGQSHLSGADIDELIQDLTQGQAISLLQSSWGEGASVWDLNADGSVSGIDLAILMAHFNLIDDQDDDASHADTDTGSSDSGSSDSESDDAGDSDGGSNDSEIETLVPGNGFSNTTNQPGIQGNSQNPGYGAKAIARWTELPTSLAPRISM